MDTRELRKGGLHNEEGEHHQGLSDGPLSRTQRRLSWRGPRKSNNTRDWSQYVVECLRHDHSRFVLERHEALKLAETIVTQLFRQSANKSRVADFDPRR